MRLKEGKSNYRASNLISKLQIVPESAYYHSKKDTRRWCKGKSGVLHDYQLVRSVKLSAVPHFGQLNWRLLTFLCSNCNRKEYQSLVR